MKNDHIGTKTAIVPMSAKPFHKGHWNLISHALQECDEVIVFISTTDRKRKNEYPITWQKMSRIWSKVLMPELSKFDNLSISFETNPITAVHDYLGNVNISQKQTFYVYGDETDVFENFDDVTLKKYHSKLLPNIKRRGIPRQETDGISGTEMRKFLSTGNKSSFINGLPESLDSEAYWSIISKS